MNFSRTSKLALFAMAFGLPCLSSASTISVTFGGNAVPNEGLVSAVAGTKTVNFDANTAPSNYTITPNAMLVQGSTPGITATPTGDTSYYLSTGTSNVDINLASSPSNYFGLDWGSIDTYNSIALTEANGNVQTYTGGQIASLAGISADGTTSLYVNFFDSGSAFTDIRLSSTNYAFESDNHAFSATPEPSTWILTAGGLGLAGLLIRRKRMAGV